MQSTRDFVEAPLETTAYRRDAELQPLAQNLAQPHHLRSTIEADDVQVDAIVALEIGGGEQVRHQLFYIDFAALRDDDKTRRILVIRLVAQVFDHRQLLRAHLLGDLLEHFRARGLPRQRLDDDAVIFHDIGRTRLEAAGALLIEIDQVGAWRDDLGARRQIRALHKLHQRAGRRLGLFEQVDTGVSHFAQVVRRNIGRHTDRDAGRAIEQQIRHASGQYRRLFHRTIEIRHPVGRAVTELLEQNLGVTREFRLGVTHRRERLRIVLRTPVTLSIDDGVAIRKRLRHQHHRLVARRIAVRMELADHVTHGTRGFLVLGNSR